VLYQDNQPQKRTGGGEALVNCKSGKEVGVGIFALGQSPQSSLAPSLQYSSHHHESKILCLSRSFAGVEHAKRASESFAIAES
jgi:hypothetical protein